MRFKITHHTRYLYSNTVFLEPHYLRFKPQQRGSLNLVHFGLHINPEPAGISHGIDAENNSVTQIWFSNETDFLNIRAEMEVSVTKGYEPLSFILDPYKKLETGKSVYGQSILHFLEPYLQSEVSKEIKSYVDTIFIENNGEIIAGLYAFAGQIYKEWKHHLVKEQSNPDAENCFRKKSGSCRDLAWMSIAMLRSAGLAARFVSGYTYNSELTDGHELHAWVEVYLPGAGWVGIDPSAGLFVHENYIPVCASFDPVNTMPVSGNYRGDADSNMEPTVEIEMFEE